MEQIIANIKQLKCLCNSQNLCSYFCFDQSCQHPGLICFDCFFNKHSSHQICLIAVKIKQLFNDLNHCQTLIIQTAKIDRENFQSLEICEKLQSQKKQIIKMSINAYYNNIKQTILNYIKNLYKIIKQNQNDVKSINKILLSLRHYQKNDEKETNFGLFLQNIIQRSKQQNKKFEQKVKQKYQTQQLIEIFNIFCLQKQQKYEFSSTKKHTGIILINSLTVQQTDDYNMTLALIQPPVYKPSQSSNKKKMIKLHMQRIISWVAIGVIYKKKAQSNGYRYDTQVNQNGGYTISNNGYTWHQSNPQLNSLVNWSYSQGDIITITVDFKNKILMFSQENKLPFSHSFDIDINDQLHFCVSLTTPLEKVSILK